MFTRTFAGLSAAACVLSLAAGPAAAQWRRAVAPAWNYSVSDVDGYRYSVAVSSNPIFKTSINYPGVYGAYALGPGGGFYPAASFDFLEKPAVRFTDSTAYLRILVPADATVWVNDEEVPGAGEVREFRTPQIRTGRVHPFQVAARWMEDGRRILQTRTVDVGADDRTEVDLRPPARPIETPTREAPATTPSTSPSTLRPFRPR